MIRKWKMLLIAAVMAGALVPLSASAAIPPDAVTTLSCNPSSFIVGWDGAYNDDEVLVVTLTGVRQDIYSLSGPVQSTQLYSWIGVGGVLGYSFQVYTDDTATTPVIPNAFDWLDDYDFTSEKGCSTPPNVIFVDGVPYDATKVSGPVVHYETPDVNPTTAYTSRHDWTGNGSDNLPCEFGIHWIDNANLLTISHCLDNPNSTTTTTQPPDSTTTTTQPPDSTTTTQPEVTTTTAPPDSTTTTTPTDTTSTTVVTSTTAPPATTSSTLPPPNGDAGGDGSSGGPSEGLPVMPISVVAAGLLSLAGAWYFGEKRRSTYTQ